MAKGPFFNPGKMNRLYHRKCIMGNFHFIISKSEHNAMKGSNRCRGSEPLKLLLNLAIAAGVLAFGLALFAYAYLGIFSRYYADDYCLTSGFLGSGFWKSQIDLYNNWSPRFAGTFILNLTEYFGRSAIRGWTVFLILSWVVTLTWSLVQGSRLMGLSMPKGICLLLAEAMIFFTILEAPHQYQSIYWRIGLITYTLPLVFLAGLSGLIFNRARKTAPERIPWWGMVACSTLAFFAGGFSETYVTLQTSLLGLALLGVWLGIRSPSRRNWLALLGASLVGSLIALIVVAVAPGNAIRLTAMPPRPHFISLIRMSLTNAFLFIYISLKNYAFQNVLAILLPAAIAYSLFAGGKRGSKMRPSPLIAALFLIPVIGYLLIVAVCAPSAYAASSYPEGRTLIEARFIMIVIFLAEGALIGLSLSQWHLWADEPAPTSLQLLATMLFLLIVLYPLYDAWKTHAQAPLYRERAATWDERDREIRRRVLQNEKDINLYDGRAKSFDEFSGLLEIGSDPRHWVNQCAANFYGAHDLTINKP